MPGRTTEGTRSLGCIITANCSYTAERKEGQKAVRQAFQQVGTFWTELGIPWKWKRSMFICRVQNAGLSGIETFLPTDRDYRMLDCTIASVGRLALRGKACDKEQDEMRYKAMTTGQVLRKWGVATCRTEATVRRLKWYQSMARNPKDSLQVLTALFGTLRAEGSKEGFVCADSEGRLGPGANPWLQRLDKDIEEMATLDDAAGLVEELGGRYLRLFRGGEEAERFVALDVTQLRLREVRACVPPPHQLGGHRAAGTQENGGEGPREELREGLLCGFEGCTAGFGDRRRLQVHYRTAHGYRCLCRVVTVTNQCPVCMTTFCSREVAGRHLEASVGRGYCTPDRSYTFGDVLLPCDVACPMCAFGAENLPQLQQHIRSPSPPQSGSQGPWRPRAARTWRWACFPS